MKKLITLTSIIAIFATSPALAKTAGNYVGLDLIQSKTKGHYSDADGSYTYTDKATSGVGLNYKYAFNFDNIFIAPGRAYA